MEVSKRIAVVLLAGVAGMLSGGRIQAQNSAQESAQNADSAEATLGSVIKYSEDLDLVRGRGLDWVAAG